MCDAVDQPSANTCINLCPAYLKSERIFPDSADHCPRCPRVPLRCSLHPPAQGIVSRFMIFVWGSKRCCCWSQPIDTLLSQKLQASKQPSTPAGFSTTSFTCICCSHASMSKSISPETVSQLANRRFEFSCYEDKRGCVPDLRLRSCTGNTGLALKHLIKVRCCYLILRLTDFPTSLSQFFHTQKSVCF